MQYDAQLVPHTVPHHKISKSATKKKRNFLPRANENSPVELRRDGRLVFLDRTRDLIRLFFPTVFGDRFDALELERVCIDAFLEAVDLVYCESIVSDEGVADGDV